MTYFLDEALSITPDDPVAVDIRQSVEKLACAVTDAMKASGYQKTDVSERVQRLAEEFREAVKGYDSLILPLVVATAIDKYAEALAKSSGISSYLSQLGLFHNP